MVVNHSRFPCCYGVERRTQQLLAPYRHIFSKAYYLAIQWEFWCYAHSSGAAESRFESRIGYSKFLISVCSSPSVVNFPSEIAKLGVTHLYVTFFVDEATTLKFSAKNIALIFIPELSFQHTIKLEKSKVLYLRPMGKAGLTIEATLFNQNQIERIEAAEGRVVFHEKKPEKTLHIDCNNIKSNHCIKALLSESLVVVCRAAVQQQVDVITLCVEHGSLPVIPTEKTEQLVHLNESFVRLIQRDWQKLYLGEHGSSNIKSALRSFENASKWLCYYSRSDSSYVRSIVELVFSLTSSTNE
ncbi:hypothetical protein A6F57_07400 [Alteromonas stellipolaris]|uniref:hypothetical protein n=1 Tax=Alteromonas stellipolaris TaxID=233316 RepID=UPI0007B44BFF|nr:hypothetical protein [Alteromonas stellipolaris]ANB25040.1 hypothetical protein A6F57_07400 [Alteromonas stellipolaris]